MKDKKLHLLRVWESWTGSLRNNCEEVFGAASVEISNPFCTTQSQRLLSRFLPLWWLMPYFHLQEMQVMDAREQSGVNRDASHTSEVGMLWTHIDPCLASVSEICVTP